MSGLTDLKGRPCGVLLVDVFLRFGLDCGRMEPDGCGFETSVLEAKVLNLYQRNHRLPGTRN